MKKLVLGQILPICIILASAGYFIYLKLQAPKSELSYYEMQWALLRDNWYVSVTAISAFLYMKLIVPKIFSEPLFNRLSTSELSQKFDTWIHKYVLEKFGQKEMKIIDRKAVCTSYPQPLPPLMSFGGGGSLVLRDTPLQCHKFPKTWNRIVRMLLKKMTSIT